jgi:hypothetical protein
MQSVETIQKMVDEVKEEAVKLVKELAEMIEQLRPLGLADTILGDRQFRKYLAVLGEPASPVKAPRTSSTSTTAPKANRTRKGKGRAPKSSDEDIVKYLKTERTVGEIRKNLGQLVPKRLDGLKLKGLIEVRKDGLKKFWKAV